MNELCGFKGGVLSMMIFLLAIFLLMVELSSLGRVDTGVFAGGDGASHHGDRE